MADGTLRIALMTHSVLPRGGVVHTLELADALSARGHTVTVIAPAEPGQQLFRRPRCQVALVPLQAVQGSLVEQVGQRIAGLSRALPALLAGGRFELVHAHDSLSGNALADQRPGGPPWVRTIHHLDDFTEPALAAWQRRAWQAASAIACVSDTWVQRLQAEHGVHAQRVHNGVNLTRFTARADAADAAHLAALGWRDTGQPLCLALGGVEQRKNSLRLLEAFARLRRNDPAWADAQLVIAGGASLLDHSRTLHEWHALLHTLGLQEGASHPVWRTGPLPDAAVPALLRRASVLASPSLMEGFGLAAIEALACGTPALVSRRAPFTEHLAGCPHVAWCDPEEIDAIAAGLREAAHLPCPATPPAVCLAHSWERSAARHEAWYRGVLQRCAAPATEPSLC
jgi:glycosyltransferase-like protein